MYSMFIATLFTNAKMWGQPKSLSIGEYINKMCVCTRACAHTHTLDYYSAIRKGMKFSHLEQHGRLLCCVKEVRQRQILCNITYLWSLKITTN